MSWHNKKRRIMAWNGRIKAWYGHFMAWYGHFMIRKSALYHDADISDTITTTQHNITTTQQITHFPCSGYGGDAIASYSLQIKSQHNNTITSYSCVQRKNSPSYWRKRSWYGYSVLLFFCCSFYVNRTNW